MVSPLLVIGESFEKADRDGTGHITFNDWSKVCDLLTNSALDANDKTILFTKMPEGKYQDFLHDMRKTMTVKDYEGTPSLLIADYLTKLYEILETQQHTQMKTMLEQARVIEELNAIMEQHAQEIVVLKETLEHETRLRHKLQKENMILNEKRKIEKEHFENEIQLLTERIGKLVEEKEDLLTLTTRMEETKTSEKDEKFAEQIQSLRNDVFKWRKQCKIMEEERDQYNKKYLLQKKDKEAILLELEFKAQMLEETEELITSRKREYQKDMQKLLDEHRNLVQTNKNLEFDLRTAQRQLEATEVRVPIAKALMTPDTPHLESLVSGASASEPEQDDDDSHNEPGSTEAPQSPQSVRSNGSDNEKSEFVIVKSYSNDDVEDQLKKDIAETEPILKGNLLSALGEDDVWEESDEEYSTLIKQLGSDKTLTKERWQTHRRKRSETIEKHQKSKIVDMLARAQEVKTRAQINTLSSGAEIATGSAPQGLDEPMAGTSMSEILEAVNIVRSELIKETKTIHTTLLEQVEKKNHELQFKNVELQSQLEIYFKMLTDERQKKESQLEALRSKLEEERNRCETLVLNERDEVLKERNRNKELQHRIGELEKKRDYEKESFEKRTEGFECKIAELKSSIDEKDVFIRDVEKVQAEKDLQASEHSRTLERELALKDCMISEVTQQKLKSVIEMQKEIDKLRHELAQIALHQSQQKQARAHQRQPSSASFMENFGFGDFFQ